MVQAQQNIKPFEDLWKLVDMYDSYILSWTKDTSIFKLDPELIEKETKIMF